MLYQENWTQQAQEQLRRFETRVVEATKVEGYDGKDPQDQDRQWSFSGALLYSVTVITTIGESRTEKSKPRFWGNPTQKRRVKKNLTYSKTRFVAS